MRPDLLTPSELRGLSDADLAAKLREEHEELERAESDGRHLMAEALRARQRKLTTEIQRRKDEQRRGSEEP